MAAEKFYQIIVRESFNHGNVLKMVRISERHVSEVSGVSPYVVSLFVQGDIMLRIKTFYLCVQAALPHLLNHVGHRIAMKV